MGIERLYFEDEKEVETYLEEKDKKFARFFMQISNVQTKRTWFARAIELGYKPRYVIVQGEKKFEVFLDIELPKKVTPEDRVRIEHSHQNLDPQTLDKLIELKTKK
ncbi:MAG: hypothetical protein ABIH59_01505 [archaeon]